MGITIEAMKMIRGEAAVAGGSRTKEMVLFGLFTALIAIGAFIKIPVPVCPFTLQLLFTTLAGLILGSRNGACSVGLYVLLGLAGVPVFTEGGGPSYIFQPTFGYLIGFIAGAWLTGWISEESLLHFQSTCEGEAHGKGAAQAAWLSSNAAHDIFFRAG